MANVNNIISFSFCTKLCTYASIRVDICLNALKHEWLMLICVNEQFKWPVSVYGINKMEKRNMQLYNGYDMSFTSKCLL